MIRALWDRLSAYKEARYAGYRKDAAQAFEKHELLHEIYWNDGGERHPGPLRASWEIGIPGSSNFRVNIVAGAQGHLSLTGDIDSAAWAYGPPNAFARLWWMACRSTDSYFMEKLRIGSGHSEWSNWDEEAACLEILARRRDEHIGAEVAREATRMIESGCYREDAIRGYVADEAADRDAWEWAGDLGAVKSSAPFYLQAALKRCDELVSGWPRICEVHS